MLLRTTLTEERRHHPDPQLPSDIPTMRPALRHYRVVLQCRGGAILRLFCDGESLAEAIRKAELSAHWRGLVPIAITWASQLGD